MNIISTVLFFCLTYNSFAQASVKLTFRNGSLKSIPLVIPGVMNPNLSPMSKSGVELTYGQEVLFFQNGDRRKQTLLFVVGPQFKDGEILDIDDLVREKMKEKCLN
jgi:hypothetical protein